MNKKILIAIGVLVTAIVLLGVYLIQLHRSAPTEEQLSEKFSEFKTQYQEKKAQGYDVSEAERLAREAKEAYENGNYKLADELLDKAFSTLETAGKPPTTTIATSTTAIATTTTMSIKCSNNICESNENGYNCPEDCCVSGDGICPAGCTSVNDNDCETGDLSQVKVAVVYEKVVDGLQAYIERDTDDVIKILKETRADFIFRGWWRWAPHPNNCEQLPSQEAKQKCRLTGHSYKHLENATTKIKEEIPDIIFCGAVPAQIIQKRAVWNPITEEVIEYPETWDMALDPGKWGFNVSKKEFQCWFAKTHYWVPKDLDCEDYDPEETSAYFPDITNEKFQELLLSWSKRQIDCGADAIWIDMLFTQTKFLTMITRDASHPAVEESYKASSEIVDEIHSYGYSKGRYVYVGSWSGCVHYPYPQPDLDFVTMSPSRREILTKELNETIWDERISRIREKMGDIPVFAFIDWAGDIRTPLGAFSQNLTSEEQREYLKTADEFFLRKGIIFAYPLHGGNLGIDAEVLSFNIFKVYDSLAPEFETYETIKELALNKSKL